MTHKDLDVWKLSMGLVVDVYQLTDGLPKSETFGLTSQVRRAVVSVPSNIAEGAARKNLKEYIQFLYVALGSISEVDTQLKLILRLGFAEISPELLDKIEHVKKMLLNLIKVLKEKDVRR
ncbi:four helix bundle protein [uncultured Acetobacteroides sp.]|uniref:four helix bundle protein n=1 Tax=uncultured Acetobacteroides sp. TaxID=1760811 RepID=UPI0029F520DD|nr:four helix bundle protein [uncultured Acetobacteroides sp.]